MIVKLAHNAVNAKLIDPSQEIENIVSELLSYLVDGADKSFAFNTGTWDGRSSFYEFRTHSFPAGFVYMVHAELTRRGHKVQLIRKPHHAPLGPEDPIVDEFGNDNPDYDFQIKALRQVEKHGRGIIQVATGGGKCLGKDTPVLMFDGTVKMVQDVEIGDQLMGPDSKPRLVLSTCKGRAPLYRVTPTKGDSYVVNDAHILSLKKTSRGYRGRNRDGEKYPKGEIVNINVEDYLAETKTFRHIHKGWRTGVDFEPRDPLLIDPYFVGLLLGDGSIGAGVSLTTADPEIVAEIERQAKKWDLKVMACDKARSNNAAKSYHLTAGRTGGKANPLTHALRLVGLGAGEKFIPHIYKTASRQERLELLAGIIDTDGYYDGKDFYVTLKSERLLDDVIFVARSLGFAAYKRAVTKKCHNTGAEGTYYSTVISGHLDEVPVRLERRKAAPRAQKKDHLVTGLTVEPIGEGDYYGFEIDGDHLFLLGDFTVTHNTKIGKLVMMRFRRPTLFLTTRGVLMYQMAEQLEALKITTGIVGDSTEKMVRGINLGMVQTLVAALKEPNLDEELFAVIKANGRRKAQNQLTDEQIAEKAQANFDAKTKRRNRYMKFLELIEVVIGEEAHEAGGNSYYEILKHCKNASVRVALTATPFMRESAEDNMRLMAAFGPVLIQISEEELISRGILATPHFKFVMSEPHPKLFKSSPWERARKFGIVENPFMHKDIIRDALMARKVGLPVLTLINIIEHGDILLKKMQHVGLRAEFLKGEDNQKERKRQLDRLAGGEIDVLIGSTIVDVGVDVPAIGLVQIAGGGKAEVQLRQRIGRGLRAKKAMPNHTFIALYSCKNNITLAQHFKECRKIIEGTPGFDSGVLPNGEDFPWAIFANNRKAAA